MNKYKNLIVWKRAVDLAILIYKSTDEFPVEEKYGLTSQLRRPAVSISSNIAEGVGRNTKDSFKYFLSIAYGSSYELETQIIISTNLNFIESAISKKLCKEIDEIQKMIYALSKNIEGS